MPVSLSTPAPSRAPVALSTLKSSPTPLAERTPLTAKPVKTPENPIQAGVVFYRDGIKVSRVVMNAGSELPVHSVGDDIVIVVVRGVGIVFAQQEPRHVEAGSVVDLVPGEEHSIESFEEMEFVICQMSLASRAVPPPAPPAG